jgi:hypothetical protein
VSFDGKMKEKKQNACSETEWNNETSNDKSIFGEGITFAVK